MTPIPSIRTKTAATIIAARTARSTRNPRRERARSNKRILLRTTSEPLIVRREIRESQKRSIPLARTTLATEPISFATRNSKPWPKWERFASSPLPISLVLATAAMPHAWNAKSAASNNNLSYPKSEFPLAGTRRLVSLALTKRGARLVRKSGRVPDEQAIYHGFAKPREAKHDADLYRLYQAEAKRIESAGGRPTRVVLDYELKRNLNRDLAALDEEGRSPEALERDRRAASDWRS